MGKQTGLHFIQCIEPSATSVQTMGLIKEPKHIDLSTKSEPWTEKELADFWKIMQNIKVKNAKRNDRTLRQKNRPKQVSKQ